MDARRHVRLMAEYNRWMNQRVAAAAAGLSPQALAQDRGAPFGSILGTLNQQAVGDCVWLRRFEAPGHWARLQGAVAWLPQPVTLRDSLAHDMASYRALRERLDELIFAWCSELIFNDLDRVLAYRNMGGEQQQRQVGPLLSHLFNHQSQLRGQVATLLFQAGVDIGTTDLTTMPGFDPFTAVPEATTDAATTEPAA
jgi:uncharacterized damage-inducible protein DinB